MPNGDDGKIDAAIQQAEETLRQVSLDSFTATPTAIRPFEESTLEWRVTLPEQGRPVSLFIGGRQVEPQGTMTVSPTRTATFVLRAVVRVANAELRRELGAVIVSVDTQTCRGGTIPEVFARDAFMSKLEEKFGGDGSIIELAGRDIAVKLEGPRSLEIVEAGILIKFGLRVMLPSLPDVAVSFDVLAFPSARDCTVTISFSRLRAEARVLVGRFRRFLINLVLRLFGLPSVGRLESEIEDFLEDELRKVLSDSLRENVDRFLSLLPPDLCLTLLDPETDQIVWLACPTSTPPVIE